jgi:Zn-dependent protease with chaperone function
LPIFSRKPQPDKPLLAQLKGDAPGLGKTAIATAGDPKILLKYRTSMGVVVDPTLDADLNAILGRLQAAWPDAPSPARVHVIPDSDFSARTYGSGDIFVAAGALESMESEDEVAAMLAHEYSHVLLHHAHESKLDEAASGLFTAGMLYAMYRNGKKPDDAAFVRQFGIGVLAMETVSSGLVPAMTRRDEDEADRLGMDLMIRAGYNPVAMTTMLERMIDWEARNAAAAQAREQQAARLDDAIKAESNGQVQLDLTPVINAIFANISAGIGKLMSKLRRQHADATERREHAKDYLRVAHADAQRPALRPVPWAKRRQVQALFAGLAETREAWGLVAGEDGADRAKARALAEQVRKTPAGKSALPRYLVAILSPGGKTPALLAAETKADDSLIRAHLDYIEAVGARDHALGTSAYERAHAVFGDDPQLQPYAARFAPPKPGNPAMTALCDSLKGDLKATCQAVAKGS